MISDPAIKPLSYHQKEEVLSFPAERKCFTVRSIYANVCSFLYLPPGVAQTSSLLREWTMKKTKKRWRLTWTWFSCLKKLSFLSPFLESVIFLCAHKLSFLSFIQSLNSYAFRTLTWRYFFFIQSSTQQALRLTTILYLLNFFLLDLLFFSYCILFPFILRPLLFLLPFRYHIFYSIYIFFLYCFLFVFFLSSSSSFIFFLVNIFLHLYLLIYLSILSIYHLFFSFYQQLSYFFYC